MFRWSIQSGQTKKTPEREGRPKQGYDARRAPMLCTDLCARRKQFVLGSGWIRLIGVMQVGFYSRTDDVTRIFLQSCCELHLSPENRWLYCFSRPARLILVMSNTPQHRPRPSRGWQIT